MQPPAEPAPETSRLARDSLIVGAATILSRLLGFARDVLIARLKKAGVFTDTRFNRELIEVKLYRFVQAFRQLFPDSAYDATIAKLEAESARRKGVSPVHSVLAGTLREMASTTIRTGTTEALKALPLSAILSAAFKP